MISRCPTLIRPPLVKRESIPAAGFVPRERARRSGSRGAADFISTAVSDTVVCTKHLLRLELVTTMLPGHQRGEQQRLRGLETHLCPPAGRLKATGSGRRPVPVSTQLGRGAAHSSSSQQRHAVEVSRCRGVERARESNQRTGLRDLRAQMLVRGPCRTSLQSIHSGSVPCWVQLGARLSRAPRSRSVARAHAHLSTSLCSATHTAG